MHGSALPTPRRTVGPANPPSTKGLTRLVYRNIRAVAGWVGAGLDGVIGRAEPLLDRIAALNGGPKREALVAVLNGVLGDHLAATSNPLATPMAFRRHGRELARPEGPRCVLLIHGLCMSDTQWRRRGHDHGDALQRDLGWSPAYLRYNSGRHVSTNGRELAEQLETWLHRNDPQAELAIVGFSLGGLVARSAVHYARQAGHAWPARLRHLVFLGTPHLGAPLERGGAWVDMALGLSRFSAPFGALARIRSAGITDLRHGSLLDDDWQGRDRFGGDNPLPRPVALPRGVRCAAIAASRGNPPRTTGSRMRGDGIVPVASALGVDPEDRARSIRLPASRRWVGHRLNHLDLLCDASVYAEVRHQLRPLPARR